MKVGKFTRGGACAPGIVQDGEMRRVGPWRQGPAEWQHFELPGLGLEAIAALPVLERVPLDEVGFLPPLDAASRIVCIGLNYAAHIEEAARQAQARPGLFLRSWDTLQGHGQPIVRPSASEQFDYEGEIAVVIGKAGRAIAPQQALSHVFGYTCLMDGSVRDFQKHSVCAGKNFWRSGAMGPWICTADEVPDPAALALSTRVNGEQVQAARADAMVHGIPALIAYVSQWAHLRPADVIATGTPAGVGAARKPPRWLRPGDLVEVCVDAVGTLANRVEAES